MEKSERFWIRCSPEWRAMAKRVAQRLDVSEAEAMRVSVEFVDANGISNMATAVAYDIDIEGETAA
jgi:hypothetical protein